MQIPGLFCQSHHSFIMSKTSVSVLFKISNFTVLGRIHTNRLINCCSDMSTIAFSDQSSVFFYTLQWAEIKFQRTLDEKIRSVPRIVIARNIIDNMVKMKLTPRATQTNKTQQFIIDIDEALEVFKEDITSLSETTRESAYKNFLTSYRAAMIPIWNLSRFANINTVLDTITDKQFSELKVMKTKLREKPPEGTVIKENIKIPTLEDFTDTTRKRLPKKDLLDSETCRKIGDVFSSLAATSKAYSEAASGIAELASKIKPNQMMTLLSAATLPAIQIVILGQLLSPISTPPPPSAASTTLGKKDIINYTKQLVLPNPNAPELLPCDSNSATRVLAATTYCKLEHCFFEETQSRADVATAFQCNTSQVTKVVTGIIYKLGPHHYVAKKQRDEIGKKTTKRAGDSQDPNVVQPKARKTMATTLSEASTSEIGQRSPETDNKDDTLSTPSSSSNDSPLPQAFLILMSSFFQKTSAWHSFLLYHIAVPSMYTYFPFQVEKL